MVRFRIRVRTFQRGLGNDFKLTNNKSVKINPSTTDNRSQLPKGLQSGHPALCVNEYEGYGPRGDCSWVTG